MQRGVFIVLEGPDGSGTTRHTELLSGRIARGGRNVVSTAEPTGGPIGALIRTLLHGKSRPQADAVQLLFCADRAEHVAQVIEPALRDGSVVISDRYALSTIVYGTAQGLSEEWLASANSRFPVPDLTVILLPPLAVCLERTGRREVRDQYEQTAFQEHIYAMYGKQQGPNVVFVDTSGDKDAVAEEIWRHVAPLLR